jgi:uncharacterized protein YecE (DUF72 family)
MAYTGTSGYSYDHWTSKTFTQFQGFYPLGMKKTEMFNHYSRFFNFVEINSTFYGNPSKTTVVKWYNASRPDFRFLVKANKYITHSKKMLDFEETFPRALELYENLKEKCVGILFQLPPTFQNNPKNFQRILDCGKFQLSYPNPYKYQIYIEFRHPSWFVPDVYQMLTQIGWSLTIVNVNNAHGGFGSMSNGFSPPIENPIITVPNTIMFRCHGTFGCRPYMGPYGEDDLIMMASIVASLKNGLIVFDNTDSYQYQLDVSLGTQQLAFDKQISIDCPTKLLPHAVQNALQIKQML